MDLKQILDIAESTAREAGQMLKEHLGDAGRIEYKGAVDLVTEMDRKSEEFIVDKISARFPDHGILSEEAGGVKEDAKERWIIDPLDGTTNYAHGFPVFCVSIAFEKDGQVLIGVVYDPMLDEMFTAERGSGAYLNDRAIGVSATAKLDRSLLATGFPYDLRTSKDNNLDNFSRFAVRAQAIRRAGAAALDLCYVASGRFDGFWEMKLFPWDVAAATLVVTEAGGRVTDFSGGPFKIYDELCLATNGLIHSEMMNILKIKAVG